MIQVIVSPTLVVADNDYRDELMNDPDYSELLNEELGLDILGNTFIKELNTILDDCRKKKEGIYNVLLKVSKFFKLSSEAYCNTYNSEQFELANRFYLYTDFVSCCHVNENLDVNPLNYVLGLEQLNAEQFAKLRILVDNYLESLLSKYPDFIEDDAAGNLYVFAISFMFSPYEMPLVSHIIKL